MFQLCMSVTCGVVSETPHTVAYVDGSAGGFDPAHLWACLDGKEVEGLMEKVRVYQVFTVYELLSLLHSIHTHLIHQVGP